MAWTDLEADLAELFGDIRLDWRQRGSMIGFDPDYRSPAQQARDAAAAVRKQARRAASEARGGREPWRVKRDAERAVSKASRAAAIAARGGRPPSRVKRDEERAHRANAKRLKEAQHGCV